MASLITNPNGTSRITWMDGKKHRTIHCGKMSKTLAKELKLRIESLVLSRKTGAALSVSMTAWLGELTDEAYDKLANAGLVPKRQTLSLGAFVDAYRERRAQTMKPASMVVHSTITNELFSFFDRDRMLRTITVADAQAYETFMRDKLKGLAPYTIVRRLTAVKAIFADAVRLEVIDRNPFSYFKAKYATVKMQKHYVSVQDTQRILEHCSPNWRLIVALSRFAGLRCPTEVLSLKWETVNLPAGRMVVHSPKTEHIAGKAERVVPIFAQLRPYLEEAFEAAEDGAEYVVGGSFRASANGANGWKGCSMSSRFHKIIRRAGLVPWPKLFNAMRASCETDLCQEYPAHVVCEWIGHSALISQRHYTQVLESHFAKAAQNPAQVPRPAASDSVRSSPAASAEYTENEGNPMLSSEKGWTLRDSNYCDKTGGMAHSLGDDGARNGAIAELTAAWPYLTAGQQFAILAIAKVSTSGPQAEKAKLEYANET